MNIQELGKELSATSYPGRGIVLGLSADGKKSVIVYFIMGRSENSRNRVFEKTDTGIRTRAFDESKMTDPSLVIYHPVRTFMQQTIVTNGDQTDTIDDYLTQQKTFEEALRTRTFEPDAPNFTPRISGIVDQATGAYKLSILKSSRHDAASVQRFFFEYPQPKAGEGHFIHTYMGDGDPLPSFEGEPTPVSLPTGCGSLADFAWSHLDPDNKVSLFVRLIDRQSGEVSDTIINRY